MSTSSDLKALFQRARPLVEQQLDIADDFADMREEARTKGLDWAQIKSLLKAEIQDGRDGGERVKKIVEKADLATAYADMLGLAKMNEKSISREAANGSSPPAGGSMPPQTTPTATGAAASAPDQSELANALRPASASEAEGRQPSGIADLGTAAVPPRAIEKLDIPPNLLRGHPDAWVRGGATTEIRPP
jgi:uncharacterized protein (UPF0335 family)